jgi:hypothetical protein
MIMSNISYGCHQTLNLPSMTLGLTKSNFVVIISNDFVVTIRKFCSHQYKVSNGHHKVNVDYKCTDHLYKVGNIHYKLTDPSLQRS